MKHWILAFTCLAISLLQLRAAEAEPKHRLIFPFQSKHVHSSSTVQCPNGDLLAVWFHGTGERTANDVQIQGSRLRHGQDTWDPPFIAADTPNVPDCNPVVFLDAQQRLWLIWIVVQANRWEHSILKYRISDNFQNPGPPQWKWQEIILLQPDANFPDQIKDGFKKLGYKRDMWGEYARPYDELIVEAARDQTKRETGWMTRCLPLTLPSGRILLPLYSDGFNLSMIAISDDAGTTWRTSQPLVGLGNIQPTLARRKDGTLLAFMRDGGGPPYRVLTSLSRDEGQTWSIATDTSLPNPGSSLAITVLADGRWIIALNDTERGRHQLSIAISTDEGQTWPRRKTIQQTEFQQGSFAYPTLIQTPSGKIHITYSIQQSQGASIQHTELTSTWLDNQTTAF